MAGPVAIMRVKRARVPVLSWNIYQHAILAIYQSNLCMVTLSIERKRAKLRT
jgi:hypothetical protein